MLKPSFSLEVHATNDPQPCPWDQYHIIHLPALFKCTLVLELKFSKGIFWGAYFLYVMGEICISVLALEGTLCQHFFFFCQIIVYVIDPIIVEEKEGEAYFAELILPQPLSFSNPIDWMYQPLHFCSWLPIIILLLLLSWFCVFLKAITYLQSAYRLKGEDIIEAHDITEIAGVWYYSC